MSENTRNLRRKKHYSLLIKSGYNSKLATKYRDYSTHTILQLCKLKYDALASINEIDKKVQLEIELLLCGK